MHEFHGDRTHDHVVFCGGEVGRCRRGRSDAEARAHPLAAGRDQVRGDLFQQLVVGFDRTEKLTLGLPKLWAG